MKLINNTIKIGENNYTQNDKMVVSFVLNAMSAQNKGEYVLMGNLINKFSALKDNEEFDCEISEIELIKKKLEEAIAKDIFTQTDNNGNKYQIAPKPFILQTILYYDSLK